MAAPHRPSAPGVAGPGIYSESAPELRWTGSWAALRSAREAGPRVGRGETASVALHFFGTGVRWVSRCGHAAGVDEVRVDGRLVATVDRWAPRTPYRSTVFELHDLPPGEHVVEIRPAYPRGPAPSDDDVVVDAIVVT